MRKSSRPTAPAAKPAKPRRARLFARPDPQETAALLRSLTPHRPHLAIVLGTGLSHALEPLDQQTTVDYANLPGFHPPSVQGHAGHLAVGLLCGSAVAVLAGRSHYYEGLEMADIAFPVRVLAAFGIESLLLTNAAGGINRNFRPGDFMMITDHINFMGENPLRNSHGATGQAFVNLSQTYDLALRRLLRSAARETRIKLRSGVYLAVAGPTFETPAEIRAFARWGADAVGMSTVPEAVAARHCGMRVAAISLITNRAAGLGRGCLAHTGVTQVASRARARLAALLTAFVKRV